MIKLDTLELPDEMIWVDRYSWTDVREKPSYTANGGMVINRARIQASKGRPITLSGDNAWIYKKDLVTLYDWFNEDEKTMTLTLHTNEVFTVGFRHWDYPALEANTIIDNLAYADEDDVIFLLTLKLFVK